VAYVVIGAFGRIVQGAEETTDGVDIAPSLRDDNLRRLTVVLADLGTVGPAWPQCRLRRGDHPRDTARRVPQRRRQAHDHREPAGTRDGYNDLRRAATREPIGKGLRISVASTADLARMLAALGREEDVPKLIALRRLQALEQTLGRELSR
jgi:hypothetical protein